ncbi:MAG TPA: DNA starvation/stationary phase protection protein [Methylocystis sp.]|nr:DNA starvation/stationary phase protection protein [Methylocystis sp.]
MATKASFEQNFRPGLLSDADPEALAAPCGLPEAARTQIAEKMNQLIADAYVLYAKTKNFQWHVSGPNFGEFQRLLDEQSRQIIATVDALAERVRKLGHPTVTSLSRALELSTIEENKRAFNAPGEMLKELMEDNIACSKATRELHELCDQHEDAASAAFLEEHIDAAEQRVWFLFEEHLSVHKGGH